MTSPSSSRTENNRVIASPSSISVIRSSARLRRVSRENQLLHRTRSGGVDHSSSPQSERRKSSISNNQSSITTSIPLGNAADSIDTSDDTDEDVNEQETTITAVGESSRLDKIDERMFFSYQILSR